MKVAGAVQEMTKSYLHRIIDSFTRDFPKPDEDKSREIILRNVEELTDSGRIRRVLDFADPFDVQVLVSYIFEALVNRSDFAAAEGDIIEEVTALEQRVLDAAMDPASLRYEDSQAVEIMTAVLEVALEDEKVTDSERSRKERSTWSPIFSKNCTTLEISTMTSKVVSAFELALALVHLFVLWPSMDS